MRRKHDDAITRLRAARASNNTAGIETAQLAMREADAAGQAWVAKHGLFAAGGEVKQGKIE